MRRANVIGALAMVAALAACDNKADELTIRRVEPNTGTPFGGELVTIHGTGFSSGGGATGVTIFFGDKEIRPQQIVGSSQIIVKTPSGPKNESVDIHLMFDDARDVTLKDAFTYDDLSEGFGVDELVTGESVREE
jgi:hypothetical protein